MILCILDAFEIQQSFHLAFCLCKINVEFTKYIRVKIPGVTNELHGVSRRNHHGPISTHTGGHVCLRLISQIQVKFKTDFFP